jgi:hypothetical protein
MYAEVKRPPNDGPARASDDHRIRHRSQVTRLMMDSGRTCSTQGDWMCNTRSAASDHGSTCRRGVPGETLTDS